MEIEYLLAQTGQHNMVYGSRVGHHADKTKRHQDLDTFPVGDPSLTFSLANEFRSQYKSTIKKKQLSFTCQQCNVLWV